MQAAIEAFRACMNRVHHLGGLHGAMHTLTTPAVDVSDLLRAQIVLGVSALDYYVHEITILGMVEIFEGKRTITPAFAKFRVSMGAVIAGNTGGGSNWFESDVRDRHSFLAFQQPDNIADAIRLFSEVKLWKEVGIKMTMPENDIKARLKLIIGRRNKIAHEADIDPSYPGQRWPITKHDVDTSLSFITYLCESIHCVVA